jgi:hypothetical protein
MDVEPYTLSFCRRRNDVELFIFTVDITDVTFTHFLFSRWENVFKKVHYVVVLTAYDIRPGTLPSLYTILSAHR